MMRPKKDTIIGLLGLLALALAGTLFGFCSRHFPRYNYNPVRMPVQLVAGFALTNDFEVDHNARYVVGLNWAHDRILHRKSGGAGDG